MSDAFDDLQKLRLLTTELLLQIDFELAHAPEMVVQVCRVEPRYSEFRILDLVEEVGAEAFLVKTAGLERLIYVQNQMI